MPEGWAWCRLGDLCLFQNGYAFLSSKFSKAGKTKVIRISDITDGFVDESNCVFSLEEVEDDSFLVKKGDLLIAMSGATTGKNGIYNSNNIAYINQRVGNIKVRTPDALLPDFRNYYIQAMETEILKQAYGGAQPNISSTKILEMFFPLPPLIEQKEIVSKLEIAFEQIISIDANKNDLQIAIKKAKSKILDLAIHGKLVPQDSNDEPASILLEKLRAEKEEKIAKGELKRDKNDSYIYKGSDNCYYEKFNGKEICIDDEIPFEIPEGWIWCRLPSLCEIPITDGTHQTPTYSNKECGIPFLSSKDVTSGKIDWSNIKYITKELHEQLYKRIAPKKCDILLAKNGTTGVAAMVEDDTIFDIYVTLAVLRPVQKMILPVFLLYVINSPFCKKQFNEHLTGIGVPNLHLIDINRTIIPIPPLKEQERIVSKIKKLFLQLDQLQMNIV